MICPVCDGSGNLWLNFIYWDCRYCGGDGVLVLYGPKYIGKGKI